MHPLSPAEAAAAPPGAGHVTIVDSADSTARVVSQLLRKGLPKAFH